jgi:hypothetical protein
MLLKPSARFTARCATRRNEKCHHGAGPPSTAVTTINLNYIVIIHNSRQNGYTVSVKSTSCKTVSGTFNSFTPVVNRISCHFLQF